MITDAPAAVAAVARRLWQQRRTPAWLPMQGNSMLPILRPGDQLWVTLPQATYRLGQIVVIRRDGQLVVHRLIARCRVAGQPGWITQGDNCYIADEPVVTAALEGQVIALRRAARCYQLTSLRWQLGGRLVAVSTARGWGQGRRRLLRLLAATLGNSQ